MSKWLAAVLMTFSSLSLATSTTRDYSDLWYNTAESGWGANMIQQGDTIFMTLFVYAPGSAPIWYVASDLTFQGTVGTTQTFTGPLYQTSGPYFGAAFNPNNVTVTQVGTVTFSATSATTGTLNYTVSGVNVIKNLVRQTWRSENLAGVYVGATIGTYSNCPSANGPYESPASFTFTQTVNNITISEFGSGYQCSYTGFLSATGRMGTITGSGSCTPGGTPQTFTASEVQVSPEGLSARFVANAGNCLFTGRIGGVRR